MSTRQIRNHKLFPTDMKEAEWLQFPAAGFSQPACGIIRRRSNPATYGMPLGGIDTGCLALETDGTFGLCSVFNSFVPMRGPLKLPFLGMDVGNLTWLLTTASFRSNESLYSRNEATPSEIHYWGHFPVADLEYETDAPGVIGKGNIRTGGDLGVDGGAWSRLAERASWSDTLYKTEKILPAEVNQAGASVAVDFELKEREEKVIRFVLSWYSSQWKGV